MTNYLAFDIGTKRTGVAFADTDVGIAFPQDTLQHSSVKDLCEMILSLAKEKNVQTVLLGLPLLVTGTAGKQVQFVKTVGSFLEKEGLKVLYLDERYTSKVDRTVDSDASAASVLLEVFLSQQGVDK